MSTVISSGPEAGSLPPEVVAFVQESLSLAMQRVFLGVVVVGVAGLMIQLIAPARGSALSFDDRG
jgi:hypothetical protein